MQSCEEAAAQIGRDQRKTGAIDNIMKVLRGKAEVSW